MKPVTLLTILIAAILAVACKKDDDEIQVTPPPIVARISIGDASATEGAFAEFNVSVTPLSADTIFFSYATSDGTANTGDYTPITTKQRAFILPGRESITLAVATTIDNIKEINESFEVTLSDAKNATIDRDKATGTIVDNIIVATLPDITVADVRVTEGASADFTLLLSHASASAITVEYYTDFGTANGDDFGFISTPRKSITIPAGERSAIISIFTHPDRHEEPEETFTLELVNATNAFLKDDSAVGTILDVAAEHYYFSVKIDGKQVDASEDYVEYVGRYNALTAWPDGQSAIVTYFNELPTKPGSYNYKNTETGVASDVLGEFSIFPTNTDYVSVSGTGILTVTRVDLTKSIIEGTFNFIGKDATTGRTVTLTEGKFKMPIERE